MQHQNFMGSYMDNATNEKVDIQSTATLNGNEFKVIIDSSKGNHISKTTYKINGSKELKKVKNQIKNINYLNKNELKTVEIYLNSFGETIKLNDNETAKNIIKTILSSCSIDMKNIIIGAIGSSLQANTNSINDMVKAIISFFK